jgi:hypothetical protein
MAPLVVPSDRIATLTAWLKEHGVEYDAEVLDFRSRKGYGNSMGVCAKKDIVLSEIGMRILRGVLLGIAG